MITETTPREDVLMQALIKMGIEIISNGDLTLKASYVTILQELEAAVVLVMSGALTENETKFLVEKATEEYDTAIKTQNEKMFTDFLDLIRIQAARDRAFEPPAFKG